MRIMENGVNSMAMRMVLDSVADILLPADKALTAVSQRPSPQVVGVAVYLFADKGKDSLLLVYDDQNLLIGFDGIAACDLIDNTYDVTTGGDTYTTVKSHPVRALGRSIIGEVLDGDRGAFIGAMTTGADVETYTTPVSTYTKGNCIVRLGLCDEHTPNLELDFGTDTKLAYSMASLVKTVLQQHGRRARRACAPERVGRSFNDCEAELQEEQRMAEKAREAAARRRREEENVALSGQPKKILRRFFDWRDAKCLLFLGLGVLATFTRFYGVEESVWMSISYLIYLFALFATWIWSIEDENSSPKDGSFNTGFAVPVLVAHAVLNLFPFAFHSHTLVTVIYRLTGFPYSIYEGGVVVWTVAAIVEIVLIVSIINMCRSRDGNRDRMRFKWGAVSSASALGALLAVWLVVGALLPKPYYFTRCTDFDGNRYGEMIYGNDAQAKERCRCSEDWLQYYRRLLSGGEEDKTQDDHKAFVFPRVPADFTVTDTTK